MDPSQRQGYTHSYWENRWRREELDDSPDKLCFETGHYGLVLDVAHLQTVGYTKWDDDDDSLSYTDVLESQNRSRMDALPPLDLVVEIRRGSKTYRAQTARPAVSDKPGVCHGRLWEAGRIAQHYELVGIVFEATDDGGTLDCGASLYIVAWPEEFSITLSISPPKNADWKVGGTVRLTLGSWFMQQTFSGPWSSGQEQMVTLVCPVNDGKPSSGVLQDQVKIAVRNEVVPPVQEFPVTYEVRYSCFVADIKDPKRKFKGGYTDIRDHDEFDVYVKNKAGKNVYVPVMFYLRQPANTTGLVPMLWIPKDGHTNAGEATSFVPSGIPVQCSKNWHYTAMGDYLRAYALIPSKSGSQQHYQFRVYYGFYGDLCSASHANLSLVGWPHYGEFSLAGRWEQLAIGCFGETYCLDIEQSATNQMVTDVRALMIRNGKGDKWSWTDAGWGGDWLCLYDKKGEKMNIGGLKVAYLSQGPCLTDVRYGGYYGTKREVNMTAAIHTARVDDYARTFMSFRYSFNDNVSLQNYPNKVGCGLFRVQGAANEQMWTCSKVALGNGDGLVEELDLPATLEEKQFAVERKPLTGPGPWWFGFPDSGWTKSKRGVAWKALIIRSFKTNTGDQCGTTPSISLYVRKKSKDRGFNVDAILMPPKDVKAFKEGDSVAFDVEFITLPYSASDYYGPNKSFRKHLQEFPASWETIYREVTGNKLSVMVQGGTVKNAYPLIIAASEREVSCEITGGLGAVPVRFEGLSSKNYLLYEEGSDESKEQFDVAYDPDDATYTMVFNIVLDDIKTSSWLLKEVQRRTVDMPQFEVDSVPLQGERGGWLLVTRPE